MTHGFDEPQRPDGEGYASIPDVEARPDFAREARRGIPEVILGGPKTAAQITSIVRQFLANVGRALISRIAPEIASAVQAAFPEAEALHYAQAQALSLMLPAFRPPERIGHIGLLAAGTSDVPYAEEARFIAEAMGCRVTCIYDVGVAGVHRLFRPLDALLADDVDAIVVAAGMDGALPSLVAGLVPAPVIGLPTPIGYGFGGEGQAALAAMLQSCAPGLAVTNIGNGIGAGSFAALVARRAAAGRAGMAMHSASHPVDRREQWAPASDAVR